MAYVLFAPEWRMDGSVAPLYDAFLHALPRSNVVLRRNPGCCGPTGFFKAKWLFNERGLQKDGCDEQYHGLMMGEQTKTLDRNAGRLHHMTSRRWKCSDC